MKQYYFCLTILLLFASVAFAQVTFTDVAESAGIKYINMIYIICGDYDNDGHLDMLIAPMDDSGRRLYRNEGNGIFRDVSEETGVYGSGWNGAYFLDFDNDGYLDVFMSGNATKNRSYEHGDRLLKNQGDGTFVDVSHEAGLSPEARLMTMCQNLDSVSFDYDNDGFLDIFVTNDCVTPVTPNYFYRNQGNGKFSDIAARIGLDNPKVDGIIPGDYDNDGDLDIFATVIGSDIDKPAPDDQGIDRLYRNEGNGVFIDVARETGVARHANHLSGFFFDYDNDGDLDLFLRALGYGDVYGFNVLYRNNGDGTFREVTRQAGILSIEEDAFGTDYGDYDNDGWLDICVTYEHGSVLLYHNNGNGTFTNMSGETGISSRIEGWPAGTFLDYDNDGDLDIIISASQNRLYRNNGTSNHWLEMKLIGRRSNRDAIGARVKVIAGELSMIRGLTSASHHFHLDRVPVHFGLGSNQRADLIEIRWPSGIIQTFIDIPADQLLTIDEFDGILTVVHQVIPGSGHPAGGTAVQIHGESFLPGSKVLFGGIEAENVMVETPTLITAMSPPGIKGYVDVEVVGPDGRRSLLKNGFRYSSIQITKVTPNNGPMAGGIQIQIEGSGFQRGCVVKIGESQLINPSITSVLIRGILPSGKTGLVNVSVTNPDGETFVLKGSFTYNAPPTIMALTSDMGPLMGNKLIKIFGSGFIRTPTVYIGGIAAQKVIYVSPEILEFETPSITTTGPQDVLVINPDGQRAILTGGLEIMARPKIKKVEPDVGSLEGGTEITITGDEVVDYIGKLYPTKFYGSMKVLIGGVECPEVKVESDHVIRAITPPNTPGLKDITVIDPLGQDDTLKDAFTYNTAPQINRIIPNNGRLAGGTRITIQGSGFQPGAEVIIVSESGGYQLLGWPEFVSSNVVTAVTVPGNPGPRDVIVRNPDNQIAIQPGGYTYNPLPTLTDVNPGYGYSADSTKLLIHGSGFLPGARVKIWEIFATTEVEDDTTIHAVIPPVPRGVWDVRVINPDTQEAVKPRGFISVGELVYNYPNPFRSSQGTTFRYVTSEPVQWVTVKIFNLAGVPIDVIQQIGNNEVKWQNPDVHVGLYIYVMEVMINDGKIKKFRNVLEVMK